MPQSQLPPLSQSVSQSQLPLLSQGVSACPPVTMGFSVLHGRQNAALSRPCHQLRVGPGRRPCPGQAPASLPRKGRLRRATLLLRRA